MSEFEMKILRFIRDAGTSVLWGEVFNAFDPTKRIFDTDAVLDQFLENGLIEKLYLNEKPPHCRIRISKKGTTFLIRAEEESNKRELLRANDEQQKKKAEDKRIADALAAEKKRADERSEDRRFQKEITYRSTVLAAVVNVVLGALIGNLDRLIPWIISLF